VFYFYLQTELSESLASPGCTFDCFIFQKNDNMNANSFSEDTVLDTVSAPLHFAAYSLGNF
jgi:hypothetical protein